jgi:uncharacterized membrane protein YfcA
MILKYLNDIYASLLLLNPWVCLGLFVLYIALDAIYSNYVFSLNRLHAVNTANFSAALIFLTGLATFEYVHNLWYLLPMCVGAWIGSYVSVRVEKKKKKKRADARKLLKKII